MKQDNKGRGRGASVDREKDQATPSKGRGKPFGKGNIKLVLCGQPTLQAFGQLVDIEYGQGELKNM